MTIGALLYASSTHNSVYDLNLVESFLMGSLISAVDPVSTMAVFQTVGVKPQLYNLVFGESMLNDAVAIVLAEGFNDIIKDHHEDRHDEPQVILNALPKIIGIMIGSTILGIIFGCLSALTHKHLPRLREIGSHHEPLELALVISFSYMSYVIAEEIHLSGIMSVLFCGIMMDHYTMQNLSAHSRVSAKAIFNLLAHVSESFVFVYLGMAIFTHDTHQIEATHIILAIVWCLVGRAVGIFPLIWLSNGLCVKIFKVCGCHREENRTCWCKEQKRPIGWRQQTILWLSGIRGAVAFAVANGVDIVGPTRNVFITTTLILIFVTTVLFGSTTYPILKWLEVNEHIQPLTPLEMEEQEKKLSERTKSWLWQLDREKLKPFMTISNDNNILQHISTSSSTVKMSEGQI